MLNAILKSTILKTLLWSSIMASGQLTASPDRLNIGNWLQFRGGQHNTGLLSGEDIQTQPGQLWKYDTGGTVESSPTIIGDQLIAGTFNNQLFALNRHTGAVNWQFHIDGLVRASASVRDNKIYFGTDDNRFYALDLQTGNQVWSYELGQGGEQSSPLIDGSKVFFDAFDHYIYALDAEKGTLDWRFKTAGETLSSPGMDEKNIFIGTYNPSGYASNS